MMMKNVAIATDSHSSITPETAQTLGVAVLPMPFTIDGTCYLEEETLTRAEFYAHQRRGAKIATSQPAPAAVWRAPAPRCGSGSAKIPFFRTTGKPDPEISGCGTCRCGSESPDFF